jgi:hypothetical protein
MLKWTTRHDRDFTREVLAIHAQYPSARFAVLDNDFVPARVAKTLSDRWETGFAPRYNRLYHVSSGGFYAAHAHEEQNLRLIIGNPRFKGLADLLREAPSIVS